MNANKNQNVTNVQTSLFCNNSYSRNSFSYNGTRIEFRAGEHMMLNATEMAANFGNSKRPQFWLKLQSTQEFLTEIIKARNIALADKERIGFKFLSSYGGLVITQRGGCNPGTWMHEDVAIEFARWLNPKFAIWCNDRIKEILRARCMPAPVIKIAKAPKAIGIDFPGEIKSMIAQAHQRNNNAIIAHSSYIPENQGQISIDNFYWSEKLSDTDNLKKMLSVLEANTNMAYYLFYKNRQLNENINRFHDLSEKTRVMLS